MNNPLVTSTPALFLSCTLANETERGLIEGAVMGACKAVNDASPGIDFDSDVSRTGPSHAPMP